ncbi:hypothetical protein Tco_0522633 [Tanacetum coccineum]
MDPNSSVRKTCLGENIIDLSSEKTKGHGDWNSPKYQDTVNSGEAYDDEINLGKEENMVLNEFAVKLCLDHEVKCGHKVVKKELIVALRGEIYFVKFIINPEEDDVQPGVVLGSSRETEKINDDSDLLNKRKQLKKYQMIYSDMGPSLSTEKLLTHEEAAREALTIDICQRFAIPEEESPVIETMAYSNKYKKILDEVYDEVIWKAFGGNTRNLGSFGEETDNTIDIHQHLSRISTQRLETAHKIHVTLSQIPQYAEIQITSSENAHHQEERTKGLLLEEYGAIAAKMTKKRLKTKLVL